MKTILVSVDFSDVTLKVVKVAIHLAKPFQSRIILVHVFEPGPALMASAARRTLSLCLKHLRRSLRLTTRKTLRGFKR